MHDQHEVKKQPSKLKVYLIAVLIYVLVNGIFETFVTILENQFKTHLYPMFPYTRIAFLIITIMVSKYYIDKKSAKNTKSRPFIKVAKYTCLIFIFSSLTIGAYISVVSYHEPKPPIVIPKFQQPEPYQIEQ